MKKKMKTKVKRVKKQKKSKHVKKSTTVKTVKVEQMNYMPLGKCKSCLRIVKDTDYTNDVEGLNHFAKSGLCKRCNEEDVETTDEIPPPMTMSYEKQ